jgi:putative mRNA 3-end processing factor
MALLRADENGLWCEEGGFYIDPWAPVGKALITHAHSDHARPGSGAYLCAAPCAPVLRARLGVDYLIQTLPYGETLGVGDVSVSFHPAGHVLGSAQIRVEHRGEVWVVSGDYKLTPDATCTPFEPVRCDTFVTESTFGLPIYRWEPEATIAAAIHDWWRSNRERGKCSVIFGYPLGKSQRLLAALDPSMGPIFCHGAVERMNRVYRDNGVSLPATQYPGDVTRGYDGTRRRRSLDRGFVLSDHADWPGLQTAIAETGANNVLVTHGYRAPLVRWLREQGKDAQALDTRYEAEGEQTEDPEASE